MADKCKECGCTCVHCSQNVENHSEMHLHVEIEHLRQRLMERDHHIVTMETHFFNEADKFPNGELASIKEEIVTWQEKYARLYDAHKRVQKVNQNLEDKLLRIVDKCETEKCAFTKDIATLSHRLADANYTIHRLTEDNEKYRNDVNLAIQLLQCKPSNFVSQKYDSLPSEVQAKVRTYVSQKRGSNDPPTSDVKSITVPISTFPPTAMVYNISKPTVEKDSDEESDDFKPPVDIVSASIMAKVLEERERERIFAKHCDTCTCHRSILTNDAETQTGGTTLDLYRKEDVNNTTNSNANSNTYSANSANLSSSRITGEMNGNGKALDNDVASLRNSLDVSKSNSVKYINEKTYPPNENIPKTESLFDEKDNANSMRLGSDEIRSKDVENSLKGNYRQSSSPASQRGEKLGKLNVDKSRVNRPTKKSELRSALKSKTSIWLETEKGKSEDGNLVNLRKDSTSHQRHIDVINERIWKNEWSKSKCKLKADRASELQRRVSADSEINVINDRTWRTDRPRSDNSKSDRLTLIEVKGAESVIQCDSTPVEAAASPSFSSDSLVISSSDSPSSLSDANQVSNLKNSNDVDLISSWQDRTTGPRGCSMRITPGSKNILLDNAGHYQSVLYTTGNSRPNTILIHGSKSTTSGGSASICSDDNPPNLPFDNTHLERVAEWIKTSGSVERRNSTRSIDGASTKGTLPDKDHQGNVKSNKENKATDKLQMGNRGAPTNLSGQIETNGCHTKNINDRNAKHERDLITFDGADENTTSRHIQREIKSENNIVPSTGIKLTREMEENHLKLNGNLHPTSRKFSQSGNADIIDNYKKEPKRIHVQKRRDAAGSAS